MRLNRVKKILATMVCVALLAGDVLPTAASVSDGDAVSGTETTEDSFLDQSMKTVSDSDAVDTYASISGGDIALFAAAGTASDGDAQASYTVTVQHKLADEPDKKFYRDVEMTVRNDQKLQVGVLSGDDYYISQVQIYTENEDGNEELVSTVNATDIDGIKEVTDKGTYLNLNDLVLTADTRVLVLYKPMDKKVTGDVTFFDYEVAENDVEPTEFIFHSRDEGMDDALYFTYNGQTYNDYKITKSVSAGYGINWVYDNNNRNNKVTFKDGDILTNVSVNCWHNVTGNQKAHENLHYSKVIIHQEGTKYYYEAYTAPNATNAGINANAFDENGNRKSDYLGMGINGFHDNVLTMNNKYDNGNEIDANSNNTNNPSAGWRAEYGNKAIISGLVDHLEGDNYETVVWGKAADGGQIQEPGYFAAGDVTVKGRTVYSDRFNLQFSQTGHKYVLEGSIDKGNENKFTKAGKGNAGFFPLNDVPHADTADVILAATGGGETYHAFTVKHDGVDTENNPFFGMRYDFNFTLGDYEGELQYTFEGDDDMWVFLDGQLILDLGGIHSAYPSVYEKYKNETDTWAPSTVNLWDYLGDNPDRSTTHRITVLYMERGGYDSNCYMEFVLPNATPVQSVITERPTTSLELTKVDDGGQVLAGAEFTLTNKATNAVVSTRTSDENGKVTFHKLTKGEYVLRETKAPEGYEMDSKEYHVTVTEQEDGTANITASDLPANNQIVNKKLLGSLQITKKIDRMNEVYGEPSFTFKIEGPDGLVLYRTITFDSTDDLEKTKTVTIHNVPVGTYKVTEENTLRYECEEAYVKVNGQKNSDDTTAQVTGTQIPEFYFKNKLTSETYYSHTDVVVNKIHRNEDGSFTITKEKQSSEETSLQKSN